MRRLIACVMIISLIAAPGCARNVVSKTSTFERGHDQIIVNAAPRSGMYRVQFVEGEKYLKSPLYASDRWIQKGEPIGFREEDDGRLIAVAGKEEIALANAPPQATHVMWYHKSKRPTQFGRNMSQVLDTTGQVLFVTGSVIGIGALTAGVIWLDLQSDDGCEPCPPKHHHPK